MDAKPRKLKIYQTADYFEPYTAWMDGHEKQRIWEIVEARVARVKDGNFGHCRGVGEGVVELKIDFGPGFRVYFGIDGDDVVLLLVGNKASQNADIKTAKEYWRDYNA